MKKFGIMWWGEVILAVVLAIFGVMMAVGGASATDIGILVFLEILIVLDIVWSLFKSDSIDEI